MILDVEFKETDSTLDANFEQMEQVADIEFDSIINEPYTGDYTVTPKIEEQIMLTKKKVMLEDVTIRAIPFFKTDNTSGGCTVYIAKEV